MKKNVASQSIGAEMITAADGTVFTGAVSVSYTIDNGTQTAGGGAAPAHEGNGYHSYTPLQAETNGDHIAFTFTGTGAIAATVQVYTSFPQTVDNSTAIADIPTVSEFNARTLASADYFDPTTDTVANVTTVATTTTNTDMRGTDGANTVVPPSVAQFNARTRLDADYFSWATDTVANVALVATTTANTDMRGTDSANTIAPDNAGITQTQADIANLNDISVAQVFAGGDADGYSLEEALKLLLSASTGVLAGAATNTITISAADGSKTRLTATVDNDGNRSVVVKDATG